MKQALRMAFGIIIIAGLGACVSQQSTMTRTGGSMELIAPASIMNQTLEGIGDSTGRSITFKDDGFLEITTEDGSFEGRWEYSTDPDRSFRPLTISWTVDEEPHGYIAVLSRQGGTYTLTGNWYVTDAFIQLYEEYQSAPAM